MGEGRRSGWKANQWVRLDGDGWDSEVACGVWEEEGKFVLLAECPCVATGLKKFLTISMLCNHLTLTLTSILHSLSALTSCHLPLCANVLSNFIKPP
jgi:hypothetical protein